MRRCTELPGAVQLDGSQRNRSELLRNEQAGAGQALDGHAKEQDLYWHR